MLEIKDLEKSYGSHKVLKGITFEVKPSTIVGLIGKNGAGKTTIFHSLLNFFQYDGEILFDGKIISQVTFERIGYLPEERSVMPKETVFEQVTYLAQLKGMSAKEVKELLPQWMERLQVKGKMTDKIVRLSKGNQQKVQIIATLIHKPDLIILDEPFSGLDPVTAGLLKNVILAEKERGACIIFSDHIMADVEEVCDRIVMLKEGEIALSGTIQEVRNAFPKTRLTVSSELDKASLENLDGVVSAQETPLGAWLLHLEAEEVGKRLFDQLSKGRYIQTFDQQPPTLDDIFKMTLGGNQ